jgi:putative transposase
MRYPASEKLEIIRLVEQSHLPVRRTLEKLGDPAATFYRWYDRLQTGGPEALEDKASRPTRLEPHPDAGREQIVNWPWTSRSCRRGSWPRASPIRKSYFVSEASVYRLLKAHDLITSPAFIVMKAADEFKDKTTAPNQLWQTDFTYLKVIGWGWFYLSTVLDDFSRYIIAWKLCTTMKAEDVTDTLDLALKASGCDQAPRSSIGHAAARQRFLLHLGDLAEWLDDRTWGTFAARPTIRRPRARSSAGIRRSRTASCSRTTTCPAISKPDRKAFVDHYNHRRYHESHRAI